MCACMRACMCACARARACVHGARVAVLREHGAAHDAGEDAQGDAAQAAVPWRHAAAPGSIGRVAAAAGCGGLQRLIRCRRMGGLHAHAQHVHVHVTCGCRLSAARGRRSTGPSSSSGRPLRSLLAPRRELRLACRGLLTLSSGLELHRRLLATARCGRHHCGHHSRGRRSRRRAATALYIG